MLTVCTCQATDILKPILKVLIKLLCCIAPLYKFLFQALYLFYAWAPKSLIQMVCGLSLCFFGGQYLMVLAAIEAWNNTGGKDTMNNLKIVYEEVRAWTEGCRAQRAHQERSSHVISRCATTTLQGTKMLTAQPRNSEFVPPGEAMQKAMLVSLKSVKEPRRLEAAVGGLWRQPPPLSS